MQDLTSGCTALSAVEKAISTLENSPATNAGYGSSLNSAGDVECDASIMYSKNHHFGSTKNCDRPEDTVGAVCLDTYGDVAAGCSTGGPEYRVPGRVSHASVFGAGSWAEEGPQATVAVSTSGMGEQLLTCSLARKNAEFCFRRGFRDFNAEAESEFICSEFIGSKFSNSCPYKLGGSLVLMKDSEENDAKIVWGHCTKSMLIAYISSSMVEPTVVFWSHL
ncbi:threonine aspartase 1-like [Octopus sinensis]|uniref:Threonine aspartase 1-like n=1 Tax=Octopus sinensis TaxID=2607531 RepID=A0A7E6EHF4_9MOLL|nr:threonine aspartase 1-like [Octopus sinensis]